MSRSRRRSGRSGSPGHAVSAGNWVLMVLIGLALAVAALLPFYFLMGQ